MAINYTYPKFQALDTNGSPLSGGKLYTYAAGTSTPKATYTDAGAGTANANPVILDSRGEADVFISGEYKFVLKDSDDTTIWTKDNLEFRLDVISDADGDTAIYVESAADEDIIRLYVKGSEQIRVSDGAFTPGTDNDIDLGNPSHEFKDGYFDGIIYADAVYGDTYQVSGPYTAAMPTNHPAAAVLMLGNSSTIAWFYLNTAPPGWKALSTGADMCLAIAGGSSAYNVNGGNPDSAATWTVGGITKDAHTHTGASHVHQWYRFQASTSTDDQSYDSGGSPTNIAVGSSKISGAVAMRAGADITGPSALLYTQAVTPGAGGAQSDAACTQDGTWRPKASVGKLFQLDTA